MESFLDLMLLNRVCVYVDVIYVCVDKCVCMCVYECVSLYVYTCVCMCAWLYVCMCISISFSIYLLCKVVVLKPEHPM